jgi:hypothetical protein
MSFNRRERKQYRAEGSKNLIPDVSIEVEFGRIEEEQRKIRKRKVVLKV